MYWHDVAFISPWSLPVQVIGWIVRVTFVLLVGVSSWLWFQKYWDGNATKLVVTMIKRAAKVGLAAVLVTLFTLVFLPEIPVYFGVLHMITYSIVFVVPFLFIPSLAWIVGVALILLARLHAVVTYDLGIYWLVSPSVRPPALDYFPVLPWFGVVLIGVSLGYFLLSAKQRSAKPSNMETTSVQRSSPGILSWLGRNALILYVIHFPVIWFVTLALSFLISSNTVSQLNMNTTDLSNKNSPSTRLIASPSPKANVENSKLAKTVETDRIISSIPTQKMLAGGTHVFQTFNNCGPASLSMALSYYDIQESQTEIGQSLRPYQNPQGINDDKSVTLQELALRAEEYNFTAYHRPAGSIKIMQALVAQDIPVIARTWLEPGEDIGHYRVIIGYDQDREILIQDDSLQGNDLEYSYEDFNEIWQAFNYEFLVLVPSGKQRMVETILGDIFDSEAAWEQAYAQSQQQLQSNPSDIYAAFNQSVAAYQLGRYQESIAAFESVQDELPDRMLWYQIDPLLAYYRTGSYEEVLRISQSIFDDSNPSFSELHYLRGLIFEKQNQDAQAGQEFDLAEQYNQNQYWQVNLDGLVSSTNQ